MAKVARQTKTTIQKLLLEGTATDVLQNSCSKEFCKAHRKTSSSGSLFNKVLAEPATLSRKKL